MSQEIVNLYREKNSTSETIPLSLAKMISKDWLVIGLRNAFVAPKSCTHLIIELDRVIDVNEGISQAESVANILKASILSSS